MRLDPAEKRRRAVVRAQTWNKAHPERLLVSKRKQRGLPQPTRPCPDVCECCGKKSVNDKTLCLDHDHVTGAFRGWLCHKCNTNIGALGDSIAGLQRALDYLKRALQ